MKRWWTRVLEARPWRVMVALMAAHLVVTGLAFDPVPHIGGDNTAYLALARSLLDHGQYLELWDPARPRHTQYPPGFPLLLALAWLVGLRSWMALKALMLVFSTAAVGVSYLWMRARTRPAAALALGLLLAVAPGLASESGWVLSDMPFWLVTAGALLALQRGRLDWGIFLAFGGLLIRTAGLPLVVAIAAWLGLRRRWRTAAAVLGGLVVLAVVWTLRTPVTDVPYVSLFWLENPYAPALGRVGVIGLIERVAVNADRYGFSILMRILAGGVGLLGAVVGALVLAAAVVGFARRMHVLRGRRGPGERSAEKDVRPSADGPSVDGSPMGGVVELFAVLYMAMLLLWPEQWASDRFLIPLLPVLLVYAAEGASVVPGDRWPTRLRWAGFVVILAMATPSIGVLWSSAARCRAEVREEGITACISPARQAFLELAIWSRGRLPEGSVVLSRKPRQWYWYSGYPGRLHPFSLDRAELQRAAREVGARYVVLDQLSATSDVYLLPALRMYRRQYCVVQRVEAPGASATLLGLRPAPWDPDEIDDATLIPFDERATFRLPLCPPAYRSRGNG